MTLLRSLSVLSLTALLLACNSSDEATSDGMDHDMADHAGDHSAMSGEAITADGEGRILSLSEDGDFVTLDHGPIEEINMGAMRMGFELAANVDLSDYAVGEDILFRISATENDIVITQTCRPSTDGPNCLN